MQFIIAKEYNKKSKGNPRGFPSVNKFNYSLFSFCVLFTSPAGDRKNRPDSRRATVRRTEYVEGART